jgi:hypothetical protein
VWPSFSGNPASVGKTLVLGSGLYPSDSLIADYYWGLEEWSGTWRVAQSDAAWSLSRSGSEHVSWVLRQLDGREALRGTLDAAEFTLRYPREAGLYLFEATDAQGNRHSLKLLRP